MKESNENAKIYYIWKEMLKDKYIKDKEYRYVRDHCLYTGEYRVAAHSVCNLKHSLPKEITINFSE